LELRTYKQEHQIPASSLPPGLTQEVRLPNGAKLTLRPIRPDDAELEREFVNGLSPESRFYRFMAPMGDLSPRMVERFTNLDYAGEMALVALDRTADGERQVGVARYSLADEGPGCEFAIVVDDAWRGTGLARELMLALMDAARDYHHRESMHGIALAENSRMIGLARSLGFSVERDPDDARQVLMRVLLQPARRAEPT
jgi:acetyltransferase